MYVFGGIALRDKGTVVWHGDASQRMNEVLAMRQETVTGDAVLRVGSNGRITPVCRYVHHACGQVGQLDLSKWRNAQNLGMLHTAMGHFQLSATHRQRVCKGAGEVFAHRAFAKILQTLGHMVSFICPCPPFPFYFFRARYRMCILLYL